MPANHHVRTLTFTILSACLLAVPSAGAQSLESEEGRPYFVERFTPSDYGQHAQNWNIVQDRQGRVYVANRAAVLEFDGREWRSHEIPNVFVRSLAVTAGGLVCVGGVGEIGCLKPDSLGGLAYESLVHLIPEDDRAFADVWTAHSIGEEVYFQTFTSIFRWDGESVTAWRAESRFHKAFVAHDRLIARDEGVGLVELIDDLLLKVPGSEAFIDERVDAVLPSDNGSMILVTRSDGLIRWNGQDFETVESDMKGILAGDRVYHGIALSDSSFALGTVAGRILVGDTRGRLISILGTNVGLASDEMVLDLYPDHQGGLWLALDTGIMRIDVPSSLTLLDHSFGLEGFIYGITHFRDRLFVSTSQGLFRMEHSGQDGGAPRFDRSNLLREQTWAVVATETDLLAAGNDGIYQLGGEEERRVVDETGFFLLPSAVDPGRAYVGLKEGVGILHRDGITWQLNQVIGGDRLIDVRSIMERSEQEIWVGTLADGVFRVRLTEYGYNVEQLGTEIGIPAGSVSLAGRPERPLILRPDGVWSQGADGRFARDNRFDAVIDFESAGGYQVNMPDAKSLWVISGGELRSYIEDAGTFVDVTPSALRLSGIPSRYVYVEGSGVVWVAVEQGLLRFDPEVRKDYDVPYAAHIRTVSMNGHGAVLYRGARGTGFESPTLNYAANNLRFEVAATTFNDRSATRYQYWLEGFDSGWSEWTAERFKEYTNLPEGRYHFHVRARNAHGVISEVDTFAFIILPPWYRTWWAYLLYAVIAVGVVWGYARWRLHEHRLEMERERKVREEVERANARLLEANARLHEADKLKDDLLANTSHELRTPLTSILGFSSVLVDELTGESAEFAAHIQKSGTRLLRTVDALLDMARLQADTMDLEPEEIDVAAAVRFSVQTFEREAAEKDIFLTVLPQDLVVEGRIDRAALDCIVSHLVDNAVKFTETGGVTVLIDGGEEDIFITVRDSGIGMSEEFVPQLFVPFKQASDGYGRTHEGAGIGLAITHRFVRLLGGDITVESQHGVGTAFHVRLPRWAEVSREPVEEPVRNRLTGSRMLLLEEGRQEYGALVRALSEISEVQTVDTVEDALVTLQATEFDVVLVSERVADSRSLRFLSEIRALTSAPVVVVSANMHSGQRQHFLKVGFDEHLAGPFTRSRLLITLEPIIRRAPAVDAV